MRPGTIKKLQLSLLLVLTAVSIAFHFNNAMSPKVPASFTTTFHARTAQLSSYPLFNPAGWARTRTITLDNQRGTQNLRDYQVSLVIAYAFPMETDFHDIRFADNTGLELPYYIDNLAYGINATVYVKVPSIPAGSNTTLTMYYGNSLVGPVSNGKATFDFYDDFEYMDDPANHGWAQYYLNHAQTDQTYIKNGQRSLLTKGATTPGTDDTDTALVRYDPPLTNSFVFEGYFYHSAVSGMVERITVLTNNNASSYTIGASTPDSGTIPGADTHYITKFSPSQNAIATSIPFTPGQWNNFRIAKTSTSLQAFLLGQQVGPTVRDTTNATGIFIGGASSAVGPANQPWWFDDVRIRKYIVTEPVPSYGPDQQVPPDSAVFNVPTGQNVALDIVQKIPALNLTMKLNTTIPLQIQITRLSYNPASNPTGLAPLGVYFTIIANQTTTLEARISIHYTTNQAAGLDPNTLTPFTYNSTARTWTPLDNISRDTTLHLVEGTVHHFSLFGVFSQLVSHAVPSAPTCWYCTWWLWAGAGTAGAAGTGAFYRRNRRTAIPSRQT